MVVDMVQIRGVPVGMGNRFMGVGVTMADCIVTMAVMTILMVVQMIMGNRFMGMGMLVFFCDSQICSKNHDEQGCDKSSVDGFSQYNP